MRGISLKNFVNEPETVQWIVEGLIPNAGWTIFVGTRGYGKTTFALQLSIALHKGVPFLGRKTLKTKVLFIQADSPRLEWREIIRRVGPESEAITVTDVPMHFVDNPSHVKVMKKIIDYYQPGFVVFDSLYKISRTVTTDKVIEPITQLEELCTFIDDKGTPSETIRVIPWMLIHHPPHDEKRAAGHHSIEGTASYVWYLMPDRLEIAKGRLLSGGKILLDRDENGLWSLREEERVIKMDRYKNRMI